MRDEALSWAGFIARLDKTRPLTKRAGMGNDPGPGRPDLGTRLADDTQMTGYGRRASAFRGQVQAGKEREEYSIST